MKLKKWLPNKHSQAHLAAILANGQRVEMKHRLRALRIVNGQIPSPADMLLISKASGGLINANDFYKK